MGVFRLRSGDGLAHRKATGNRIAGRRGAASLFALAEPHRAAYIRRMQTGFSIAVIAAVGGTLVVLIVGVIAMLRQGKFNAQHSNKLMRLRVIFQFAAILLIALAFLTSRK